MKSALILRVPAQNIFIARNNRGKKLKNINLEGMNSIVSYWSSGGLQLYILEETLPIYTC